MKFWGLVVLGAIVFFAAIAILKTLVGLAIGLAILAAVGALVVGLVRGTVLKRTQIPAMRRDEQRIDRRADEALSDLEKRAGR